MGEPGDLWRRQDALRRHDEHRHDTIKEIQGSDPAWALRLIAGPDAAIDHLQAMQGAGTTSEPDATSRGPGDARCPHRFVTTIDQLLANVSSTPTVAWRVAGIDRDGDAVVEASTDWVGGAPLVARVLGLDSPPAAARFFVPAALLTEIASVAATLRRSADVAAEIERLMRG